MSASARRMLLLPFSIGLALLLPCWGPCPTHAKDEKAFARWESTIQAFEKQDQKTPPPKGAILFVGSSSIRMWNLAKHFPDLEVINRGFGGSEIADSVHFAPRIVTKYEPRVIVFFAGDNDLAAGKTPAKVLADFKAFVQAARAALPTTKIIFISIKPSPRRAKLLATQRQANALIEDYCKQDKQLLYLDVVTPMLGADGAARPELFGKDNLHMNEEGYRLWTALLRPHLKQAKSQ